MEAPTFTPLKNNNNSMGTIISRGISTVPLTLSIPIMSTTTATGAMSTTEISTTNTESVDTQSQTVVMATTEMSITTTSAEEIDTVAMATTEMSATTTNAEDLEDNILEHIRETSTFNRIHALVSV